MKKIYQSPITEIVRVGITTILTESAGTPAAPVDPNEPPVDAEEIESRRHNSNNIWDDDEDEQYKNQGYGW